jgi:hypothetical protein
MVPRAVCHTTGQHLARLEREAVAHATHFSLHQRRDPSLHRCAPSRPTLLEPKSLALLCCWFATTHCSRPLPLPSSDHRTRQRGRQVDYHRHLPKLPRGSVQGTLHRPPLWVLFHCNIDFWRFLIIYYINISVCRARGAARRCCSSRAVDDTSAVLSSCAEVTRPRSKKPSGRCWYTTREEALVL